MEAIIISYDELLAKVNIPRNLRGNYSNLFIEYYEEDVVLEGDLDLDKKIQEEGRGGLFIKGNLIVKGNIINAQYSSGSFLVVTSNLKAQNLIAGGGEIIIEGKAEIEGVVFGYYNDGDLSINKLIAPLSLSYDHGMNIEDATGVELNLGDILRNEQIRLGQIKLNNIFAKGVLDDSESTPMLLPEVLIQKIIKKQNFLLPSSPFYKKFIDKGLILSIL